MSGLAQRIKAKLPRVFHPAVERAVFLAKRGLPNPLGRLVIDRRSRRPTNYRQLVEHKMSNDRSLITVLFADKLSCRAYIRDRVGAHVLTPLYAYGASASSIDWQKLPREYVVKVNHGSGGVVVVSNAATKGAKLPQPGARIKWSRFLVHPDSVDLDALKHLVDKWLELDYAQGLWGRPEWAYSQISKRVFVEKLVRSDAQLPKQARFWCARGQITSATADVIDPETFLTTERSRVLPEEMNILRAMLGIEEGAWRQLLQDTVAVASDVDFVRVDWIFDNNHYYFSELTNYPSAGMRELDRGVNATTQEFERRLLKAWLPIPDYGECDRATRDMAETYLAEPPS